MAKPKRQINFINNLAICCFFLRAITGNLAFLFIGLALGILLFFYQLFNNRTLPSIVLISFLLVVLSYVLTFANNGFNHGTLFLPLFFSCTGIAWRIATDGLSYRLSWFVFYGSLFYCVVRLFVFNHPNSSLFAYSRNHISVYFINAVSLLYISSYQSRREINILPALVTFIISVLAIGFGGIVSSIIFLWLIVYYVIFRKYNGYKILLFVMSGSVLFFLIGSWGKVSDYLVSTFDLEGDLLVKMQHLLLIQDHVRYRIWSEYINSLDWLKVLTGIPLVQEFFGYVNLHSSYFLLHARMGVFAFLLISAFIYVLVKLYKKNFVFGSCFFVLLLRGLTDTTFLAGSSFDFVFLFFFLFSTTPLYGADTVPPRGIVKRCV